ncbi:MAG: cysteine hydrolase family protein [Bryobacteraceae bacterium]
MKTVFFDIDTQIDFMYPAGALYVPGAESIVPLITALNHAAPLVISTMDAHAEDDAEFQIYPHHCVAGTLGQHKAPATLLENRAILDARSDPARQLILEKQKLDCFTNLHLRPRLHEWNADRYVVYGVVTEICVRCAAFGLLKTGKRVEIVTDAIRPLNDVDSQNMLGAFTAAGGYLTTAADVLSSI